jgi:hypothetical protein
MKLKELVKKKRKGNCKVQSLLIQCQRKKKLQKIQHRRRKLESARINSTNQQHAI